MIRSVNISFDDMTITGTVESPDARPARYFRRSDPNMLVVHAWLPGPLPLTPGWTEFEPATHVSERAA